MLSGGPGSGKTALLGYARESARGAHVLSALGVESEVELAFAGVSQLARSLLALVDELPPVQRAALAGALGLEESGQADRFAVAAALLGLFSVLAESGPVLVIVDDAHLLDAASREAIGFAARRLGPERITMLIAVREDASTAPSWTGIERLPVAGVDPQAAGELLSARARAVVAPGVAERLCEATNGNPLALTELASLLTPAQLHGSEPLVDPLPIGPRVEEAFRRRLGALADATRLALVVAAASDTGDLHEVAAALATQGAALADLEPAEADGLVALGEGRVVFRHSLLRSVAYHSATPAARRGAHAALAGVIDPGEGRARRAWHRSAAAVAPAEHVASDLAGAALDAQLRGAPVTAARMFAQAARLTPSRSVRRTRLLAAAENYHLAGTPEPARPLLDDARALADDALARADVQFLRGRVELLRGPVSATCDLLITEAERVEEEDPGKAAMMLAEACTGFIYGGRLKRSLDVARRAVALTAPSDGPAYVAASAALTGSLALTGEGRAAAPVLDGLLPMVEEEPLVGTPLPALIGSQLGWLEREREGERLLVRAIDRARSSGALQLLPFALAGLTYLQLRLGDWVAARARATEGVALAHDIGQRSLSYSLAGLALVEAGLGEAACREHGRRALELAHEWGNTSIEVMVPAALGNLELGLANFEQASDQLERAASVARDSGLREPAVARWAPDLIEAYIRQGRDNDATRELAEFTRDAQATQRRGALAAAARCRGLLDHEEFERWFRAALELHREERAPFEQARTQLCYGQALRRARRRIDARPCLSSALATFELLGATPWAETTRQELQATGQHARRRTVLTSEQLTPQELHVALAVAEGATNREAAVTLFLSPKTIETHLSSAYRKLGVRSRTELAVKLDRERLVGAQSTPR